MLSILDHINCESNLYEKSFACLFTNGIEHTRFEFMFAKSNNPYESSMPKADFLSFVRVFIHTKDETLMEKYVFCEDQAHYLALSMYEKRGQIVLDSTHRYAIYPVYVIDHPDINMVGKFFFNVERLNDCVTSLYSESIRLKGERVYNSNTIFSISGYQYNKIIGKTSPSVSFDPRLLQIRYKSYKLPETPEEFSAFTIGKQLCHPTKELIQYRDFIKMLDIIAKPRNKE